MIRLITTCFLISLCSFAQDDFNSKSNVIENNVSNFFKLKKLDELVIADNSAKIKELNINEIQSSSNTLLSKNVEVKINKSELLESSMNVSQDPNVLLNRLQNYSGLLLPATGPSCPVTGNYINR